MIESTLTSKGQTTVPQAVREQLGVSDGVKLVWHVLPDGGVFVRAKSRSILDLAGSLPKPRGRKVTVAQMNPWA